MTEDEFRELLAFGREQRGVEFKGTDSRQDNNHLLMKVIRAVLSMANHRDGGLVIIGVDEGDNNKLIATGLTEAELEKWRYDSLAEKFARYADPNVNFNLDVVSYEEKNFVVIRVHQFEDIPVLCRKDFPGMLREGACYVRTRKKPETAEIPTQNEMRDLLDLAIVKALQKYISIAHAAGSEIAGVRLVSDEELFDKELGELVEVI